MSQVRRGQHEAPDFDRKPVPPCIFCEWTLGDGAEWFAAINIAVCRRCIGAGKLGLLIGDALDTSEEIERAIAMSRGQAYRARVIARERDRHRTAD